MVPPTVMPGAWPLLGEEGLHGAGAVGRPIAGIIMYELVFSKTIVAARNFFVILVPFIYWTGKVRTARVRVKLPWLMIRSCPVLKSKAILPQYHVLVNPPKPALCRFSYINDKSPKSGSRQSSKVPPVISSGPICVRPIVQPICDSYGFFEKQYKCSVGVYSFNFSWHSR